jgi:hypothetical protein
MYRNVKSKVDLRRFRGRKKLLLASLLIATVLTVLVIVLTFNEASPLAIRGANKIVSNEIELKNAVNNATKPTTIVFNKDITLTETFVIPASKDLTLTSNKAKGFYKLIGGKSLNTISVEDGGVLRLDGITVTHNNGEGRGVTVNEGGKLFMSIGEISGNLCTSNDGGGVYVAGSFTMSGGTITNNTAFSRGGGVYLFLGSFKMLGGTITNNIACYSNTNEIMYGAGGGVYTEFGSKVSFSMSGGKITGNTARYGGGIYVQTDIFNMSGGKITGNTANWGGGIYKYATTTINKTGGIISGNTGGDEYAYGVNNEPPEDDPSDDWKSFRLNWDMIMWIGIIVVPIVVTGAVLFFSSKIKLDSIVKEETDNQDKPQE